MTLFENSLTDGSVVLLGKRPGCLIKCILKLVFSFLVWGIRIWGYNTYWHFLCRFLKIVLWGSDDCALPGLLKLHYGGPMIVLYLVFEYCIMRV